MRVREEVTGLGKRVVGGTRERTGTDLATHEPIESNSFAHGKQWRSPKPCNCLRSNDAHFYKNRNTLQTYLMAKDKRKDRPSQAREVIIHSGKVQLGSTLWSWWLQSGSPESGEKWQGRDCLKRQASRISHSGDCYPPPPEERRGNDIYCPEPTEDYRGVRGFPIRPVGEPSSCLNI